MGIVTNLLAKMKERKFREKLEQEIDQYENEISDVNRQSIRGKQISTELNKEVDKFLLE